MDVLARQRFASDSAGYRALKAFARDWTQADFESVTHRTGTMKSYASAHQPQYRQLTTKESVSVASQSTYCSRDTAALGFRARRASFAAMTVTGYGHVAIGQGPDLPPELTRYNPDFREHDLDTTLLDLGSRTETSPRCPRCQVQRRQPTPSSE